MRHFVALLNVVDSIEEHGASMCSVEHPSGSSQ